MGVSFDALHVRTRDLAKLRAALRRRIEGEGFSECAEGRRRLFVIKHAEWITVADTGLEYDGDAIQRTAAWLSTTFGEVLSLGVFDAEEVWLTLHRHGELIGRAALPDDGERGEHGLQVDLRFLNAPPVDAELAHVEEALFPVLEAIGLPQEALVGASLFDRDQIDAGSLVVERFSFSSGPCPLPVACAGTPELLVTGSFPPGTVGHPAELGVEIRLVSGGPVAELEVELRGEPTVCFSADLVLRRPPPPELSVSPSEAVRELEQALEFAEDARCVATIATTPGRVGRSSLALRSRPRDGVWTPWTMSTWEVRPSPRCPMILKDKPDVELLHHYAGSEFFIGSLSLDQSVEASELRDWLGALGVVDTTGVVQRAGRTFEDAGVVDLRDEGLLRIRGERGEVLVAHQPRGSPWLDPDLRGTRDVPRTELMWSLRDVSSLQAIDDMLGDVSRKEDVISGFFGASGAPLAWGGPTSWELMAGVWPISMRRSWRLRFARTPAWRVIARELPPISSQSVTVQGRLVRSTAPGPREMEARDWDALEKGLEPLLFGPAHIG